MPLFLLYTIDLEKLMKIKQSGNVSFVCVSKVSIKLPSGWCGKSNDWESRCIEFKSHCKVIYTRMYYFILVHCGVLVKTKPWHVQGIGFHSGPVSTQCPPLVIFHYSVNYSIIPWCMGGIALLTTKTWKSCWCWWFPIKGHNSCSLLTW